MATKYATQKTRKFGGKVYQRTFHFATKGKAEEYAKSLRQKGHSVRIEPHAGVFTVYKR